MSQITSSYIADQERRQQQHAAGMLQPVDCLVFAPHPDDAELYCGATIAGLTRRGHRVVIVDATQGEMGSRGTPELRAQESAAAAQTLQVIARENLMLPDGALGDDPARARLALVRSLRRWQPQLVLSMGHPARHPDHLALHDLLPGAMKAAALHKWPEAHDLPAWRGSDLWCYEAEVARSSAPAHGSPFLIPAEEGDWERKQAALRCYKSQFGLDAAQQAQGQKQESAATPQPATAISDPAFLQWVEHRGRTWGYQAEAPYAEAFTSPLPLRLDAKLTKLFGS